MDTHSLFTDAFSLFNRGLTREALDKFEQVIAQEAGERKNYSSTAQMFALECYKLLGLKFNSQNAFGQALEILDEGLRHYPGNQYLQFYRGVVLNNSGNFPGAIRVFETIWSANPAFPAIRLCLAISLLNLGNLERTEALLRECVSASTPEAQAFHLMAVLRFRKHQYQDMESLLRRALQLQPHHVEASTLLVALLLQQGQYREAARVLSELLVTVDDMAVLHPPLAFLKGRAEAGPDNPLAVHQTPEGLDAAVSEQAIRRWIDNCFYETIWIDVRRLPFQDKEEEFFRESWFHNWVAHQYQQMVEKEPGSPEMYFRLGRALQKLREHEQAVAQFRQCLALNPKFIPAKISLAFSLRDLGQTEPALATFQSVYADFKTMPEIYLFSDKDRLKETSLEKRSGWLRSELEILQLALTQNPEFADLYYDIGRIFFFLEQPEEAANYFEKACEKNPNFMRAIVSLALTLMQLNQIERASAILNDLSHRNRLFGKVLLEMARIYQSAGDLSSCRDKLRELVDLDVELSERAREMLAQLDR